MYSSEVNYSTPLIKQIISFKLVPHHGVLSPHLLGFG